MNKKTRSKTLYHFLLCSFIVIVYVIPYVLSVFSNGSISTTFGLITYIYLYTIVPLSAAVYGVMSFIFTERIVLSHVFLVASLYVTNIAIAVIDRGLPFDLLDVSVESLPIMGVMLVISVLAYLITMFKVKE